MSRIICVSFFSILLTLALCSASIAQQDPIATDPIATPDFGDGEFEKVSDKMEQLLKLKWNGKSLALARDWEENGRRTEAHATTLLIEQGIPEDFVDQQLQWLSEQQYDGFAWVVDSWSAYKLFKQIPSGITIYYPSGYSGPFMRRIARFECGKFLGKAILLAPEIRFIFEENKSERRYFELRDNNKGAISFEFAFDKLFLLLQQSENGQTHLIFRQDGKTEIYSKENFYQFVKDHPGVTNKVLLPLFKRLGIKLQFGKHDARVMKAITDILKLKQADSKQTFKILLSELDSKSYQTRKNASAKLAAGYQLWASQIEIHLNDPGLSPEAKASLREIVSANTKTEIEQFIRDSQLLTSPEYLVMLLGILDKSESQLISDQLEEITGQSFGNDAAAWKNWLDKQ